MNKAIRKLTDVPVSEISPDMTFFANENNTLKQVKLDALNTNTDATLSVYGKPADAGVVGERISELSNDKPYQQYVTDENGVAKWEERTHYKSGLITVKLSPENTSAKNSTSSGNYYVAEDDDEVNMSFEVRSVFRAIAEDISKYQGERNDYAVYWDGIRYTGKIPRLPGKITFGDPTDINLPYMMVYSTVNGVRVQVVFYDGFEHIFAFEAFDYNIMPLNEEFIPTTVPVIPSATVGQTVVVKSVDESGKPTEWEAVDMGGGGGGVAFIDISAPKPTVWDAASGQFIPLTREKFVELFNTGTIRVVEDVFDTDPTVPDWGNSKVRGTVVGYWINSNTARVTVVGGMSGQISSNIDTWV